MERWPVSVAGSTAGMLALGDLERHVVAEVFGDREIHGRRLGLADLLQDGVAGNLVVLRRDGLAAFRPGAATAAGVFGRCFQHGMRRDRSADGVTAA